MCQSRFRLFSACQDSGFPKKFHVLPNRIYSLHFLLEYLSPSVHGQYSLTASITSKRPSPGQDCAFALWLWIFLFLTDRKLKWSPEPKQNWPRNVKLNPCDCLLSLKIMQGYTRKDGNGIGIRLIQQVFLSPPRKGTVPQNLISFTAAQMCSQSWHGPRMSGWVMKYQQVLLCRLSGRSSRRAALLISHWIVALLHSYSNASHPLLAF